MVDIVSQMVLGLGLFFIGTHLVGQNLRHLSSRSFRSLVARLTAGDLRGGLLGILFGALMQSATAVTFVLVSMVGSGLIAGRQAMPIIVWANVGLTVLAFVAGLSIRTEVLYLVGLSGVAMAFFRRPRAQLLSGVAVGIGLLLFGLETLSAGARPLNDLLGFQTLLRETIHSPLIGFAFGLSLAMLVQSNVAATLILIALARAGALDLPQAAIIIYGTNLGTIGIRVIFAAGLRGSARQMVRFEDLFCLMSGVLMLGLFYLEIWGHLPLALALARSLSADLSLQLALIFLLSNLLPALLMGPFLGVIGRALCRLWPPGKEEEDAVPKFLHPQAQGDPATALDLVQREEARLLRHAGRHFDTLRSSVDKPMGGDEVHRAFASLAGGISEFTATLARNPWGVSSAERLKWAQEELALIGQIETTAGDLARGLSRLPPNLSGPMAEVLSRTWALAFHAADGLGAEEIAQLRDVTRSHGTFSDEIRAHCAKPASRENSANLLDLSGAGERLAWMLHHLAKLLGQLAVVR